MIDTYNDFIVHARTNYDDFTVEGKETARTDVFHLKNKSLRCFGKLNVRIAVPTEIFRRVHANQLEQEEDAVVVSDTDSVDSDEHKNEINQTGNNSNENNTNNETDQENEDEPSEDRPTTPIATEEDTQSTIMNDTCA